jgi:hypothetical protein
MYNELLKVNQTLIVNSMQFHVTNQMVVNLNHLKFIDDETHLKEDSTICDQMKLSQK